jgi:amino acid permease
VHVLFFVCIIFVCFWCQELWLFYVHFFHLFFFLVKYLILLMFCFIMYWPTDNSDILRLYKIKENSAFSPLKMYMKLKKIYFRMLFDICPEQ